jgi:hypothetical protein
MADNVKQQLIDRSEAAVTPPLTGAGVNVFAQRLMRIDDSKIKYVRIWSASETDEYASQNGKRVVRRTIDFMFQAVTRPSDEDVKDVIAIETIIDTAMAANKLLANEEGEPLLGSPLEKSDSNTVSAGDGAKTYVVCTIGYTATIEVFEDDQTVSLAQLAYRQQRRPIPAP